MARKKRNLKSWQADLDALSQSILEDLHLPSLSANRLEGFAYHVVLVLPLLSSEGEPVFTDEVIAELYRIFDLRFGGCTVASSSSHPPFWGVWRPSEEADVVKDYLTMIQVLANPIDATNHFFTKLKQLLRTAGRIDQEEILISRTDCWLI